MGTRAVHYSTFNYFVIIAETLSHHLPSVDKALRAKDYSIYNYFRIIAKTPQLLEYNFTFPYLFQTAFGNLTISMCIFSKVTKI